ncbi:MAG: hypothetical protein WAV31_03900 [Candidatus Moraniibacteriota bacterium]
MYIGQPQNGYNLHIPSRKERFWLFLKNKKIGIVLGTSILLLFFISSSFFIIKSANDFPQFNPPKVVPRKIIVKEEKKEEEVIKPKYDYYYTPVPISMDKIKKQGCVTDGILSGYGGDTQESVNMINRSSCVYLHRALETWADTPDFEKASRIMEKIKKPNIVYGMFIAEAIKKNKDFYYPEKDRDFDFSEMCRNDSSNIWGEHTCKPSLNEKEYREYLKYITREAMDLGIQSFLFGQIHYQDNPDLSKSKLKEVLDDMRKYAKSKNMQIIIGAQTGTITNEKYLRMFDYIEGGVGIGDDGKIENGPCWSHLESCWALLWHERYANKANNVLLHLDWSGLKFDDMSVFARMDKSERERTLKELYGYFTSKKMGFLMPMMATINKENGGCYGPKKSFYSASKKYTCQDEGIIRSIIKEK